MNTKRVALSANAGLLIGLYVVAWWLLHSSLYSLDSRLLGGAIAIDLVITASALHYLLAVRVAGLPTWTVSPVALAGVVAASIMAPDVESMGLLVGLFAVVELAVGSIAILRIRTLVRGYRAARASGERPLDALELGLTTAMESKVLACMMVSEVRLITLALFGVFRSTQTGPGRFTVHREIGWITIAGVLVFLSAVEVPVAHVILKQLVGDWLAWPVTLLSVYGVAWIWGDAQALRQYPIEVNSGALHLRIGLRWRAVIPLVDIDGVQRVSTRAPLDISLTSPNLLLRLNRPVTISGLFGITRVGQEVSLRVDDLDSFVEALGLDTEEPRA